MFLLAVDTSSAAVTAAVHDGRQVLASDRTLNARGHAEYLTTMVNSVLEEAGLAPRDLTDVAVGVGPGPFTGLRVGLVTGRVLGNTLGVPVHGICSLDALAQGAVTRSAVAQDALTRGALTQGALTQDALAGVRASGQDLSGGFLVASDARRREVYWASYEVRDGVPHRLGEPQVSFPADLPGGLPVVGRGAVLYGEMLGEALEPFEVCAGDLAQVAVRGLGGEADLLRPPEPLYLRRPDATVPKATARVGR